MMCEGINANGRGVDGLSCFCLPLFLLPRLIHLLLLETETLPAQPPLEEQSESWNSVGFKREDNVGPR